MTARGEGGVQRACHLSGNLPVDSQHNVGRARVGFGSLHPQSPKRLCRAKSQVTVESLEVPATRHQHIAHNHRLATFADADDG